MTKDVSLNYSTIRENESEDVKMKRPEKRWLLDSRFDDEHNGAIVS